MNYEDLLIKTESYSYKLFSLNQFHPLGGQLSLSSGKQPLIELLIQEMDLHVAQDKKWHTQSYTHINVS